MKKIFKKLWIIQCEPGGKIRTSITESGYKSSLFAAKRDLKDYFYRYHSITIREFDISGKSKDTVIWKNQIKNCSGK